MKPAAPSNENDVYNLQRFVTAQSPWLEQVYAELHEGRKKGHWIWFIFPQLVGLGHSEESTYYGISGLREAEEYLKHPTLGPRLIECTRFVNLVANRSAREIFGYPDNLKFHSCMTLFAQIPFETEVFSKALEKYFQGKQDPQTLRRL